MVEKATRDEEVTDQRWARLMQIIEEAHKYKGGVQAWFKNAWNACMDGA
jgi:isopentenyldiphosphate isomerase